MRQALQVPKEIVGALSRPRRVRAREPLWEIVGDRGSPPANRVGISSFGLDFVISLESSGQSGLSEPVCLVQRLPLFVESLFEFVWEGSGGGLSWSWCVRRRMGNSLPTSMTHVCCDLCAWRSPVAGACSVAPDRAFVEQI